MKKNIIASFLLAFCLVVSSAFAAVTIQEGAVTFNSDEDGHIFVTNTNTEPVAVLLGDRDMVFDSDNNITIRQITPVTIANGTSVNITIEVESDSNLESGDYTGTLKLVNQTGYQYTTIPVTVKVPALKIEYLENGPVALENCRFSKGIFAVIVIIDEIKTNPIAYIKTLVKISPQLLIIAAIRPETGHSKEELLKAGCQDYINLPFQPYDLNGAIWNLTTKKGRQF